jgi:hypothetical protein
VDGEHALADHDPAAPGVSPKVVKSERPARP